ncbi:MAG TPA: hypothetical protein VFZ09_16485 [Archangium sp.]|uniref:esterase/lipase family protein n=1 Tax=Archangium sp. TaxID=1872627 RepID=UPI002E36A094|nr:hypothetical protein [Archangium sp.]HEX5747843.1 hypothetical protein [Archangium sp.]
MTDTRTVDWFEADKAQENFATDTAGEVLVQREAIPIIFVPGIMGSRLRRAGTDGTGKGPDGLPNMRWDPDSSMFMLKHFSGEGPLQRKRMLIGDTFNPGFLEVHNSNPVGDGFQGIMSDYHVALRRLRSNNWGPLSKIFVFPVYAFGYNWTDSNKNSGAKLAARITEIIAQEKSVIGMCEKVILVSHSMGGLTSRAASELNGAKSHILGIIHGVQPAMGAAAAYWRIKAGFEGFGMTSRVLGNSGPNVTVMLGNAPGGLQLLPNADYRTNDGKVGWLQITQKGQATRTLPKADPYKEIYRVKAVSRPPAGKGASNNTYWGLVDPDLLDPQQVSAPASAPAKGKDALANKLKPSSGPWERYLALLAEAESFHKALGKSKHPNTFSFHGTGHDSADKITLAIESNWIRSNPYEVRGFRGLFRDENGDSMQAVLQDPDGDGDGTVPVSSATSLNGPSNTPPGDQSFEVEHQPAYENRAVQDFTIRAVIALAKKRYQEKRGG